MRSLFLKKVLIPAGTALLVCAALEGLLRLDDTSKALPFHDMRAGTLVDHLFLKNASYDWVAIGSSRCAVNFDPAVFRQTVQKALGSAPTTFNAGLHGLTVAPTLDFFGRFYDRSAKKGVILMLAPWETVRADDKVPPSYGLRYYSGVRTVVDQVLMASYLFRYRALYRDPLYLYYLIRYQSFRRALVRRMGESGFVPTQTKLIEFQRGLLSSEPKRQGLTAAEFQVAPDVMAALRSMAESLKKSNRKFVILITPSFEAVSSPDDKVVDERYTVFEEAVTRGLKSTDAVVISLIRPVGLEPRHFFGTDHLDEEGSVIFSREVAREFLARIHSP
jgi:hypothetical protein